MNRQKIKILLASLMSLTIFATATSTVSWFITRQSVDTSNQLGGSVLQSYFHKGVGTKDDPFTITTPWHYENFVKLHYTVDNFAEQGFYFQFGDNRDMPEGTTTPTFYYTNENGIVDYSRTSNILNLGGMNLSPLGSEGKPFFGQVEGNSLTVKNFNINSLVNDKTANDIGIFGYVSSKTLVGGGTQRAKINGCYWSDFKINTQKQAPDYYVHQEETHKHDDVVEVGYLAGHVVDAGSFTNCYVNRCSIDSKAPSMAINNTFGYYGKAEIDSVGGQTGKGHDYHFVLDSEAAYRTLNDNYNTLRGYPMRTRVEDNDNFWYAKKSTDTSVLSGKSYYTRVVSAGKYNAGELDDGQYVYRLVGSPSGNPSSQNYYEIINDGQKHYADYDPPFSMPEFVDNAAKYPLSDAITRNGNNTYNLNGKTLNDKTAPYNYSLSSLGYQPLKGGTQHEYELSTSETDIAFNMGVNNSTTFPGIDTQYQPGEFFKLTNGKWNYQHSENDNVTYTNKKKINFTVSVPSTFTITGAGSDKNPERVRGSAYFYIDGQKVFETNVNYSLERGGSLFSGYTTIFKNVSLSSNSFSFELQRGRHYYAYFLALQNTVNKNRYCYICDTNTSCSIAWDTRNYSVQQSQLLDITMDVYQNGIYPNIAASTSNMEGQYCTLTSDAPNISIDSNAYDYTKDLPQYVNPNSKEYQLIGKNTSTGETTSLEDTNLTFFREDYQNNIEGVIDGYYHNGEFYATFEGGAFKDKITPEIGKIYRDKGNENLAPYYYNGSSYANDITSGYYNNGKFYSDEAFQNPITGVDGKYYKDLLAGGFYKCKAYTYGQVTSLNVINGYLNNGTFYGIKGGTAQAPAYSQPYTPIIGQIYKDISTPDSPVGYFYNGTGYSNSITNGYYYNGDFYSDAAHQSKIVGVEGNYYHDLTTGSYYRFSSTVFNDVTKVNAYKWMAHDNPVREVDYDADPVYIGDHPTLVDSEFDHENIDIVGGGVSFYYLERVLFWDVNIKVLTLPSETRTNYMVNAVTQDDLGKEFYSTKYCPGSVVMYIKNFSNAADNIDHELGNIKFRYANMEIGGRSRVNLEKPAFKKGSGTFVDITQMGIEKSSGQTISLQTEFECDITEAGAKKACYCALDKAGHILGVFDVNGNPGMGFLNEDGTINIDKLLAIDTYVVTLGASANASFLPTWITRVEFSYKAKQGFGGTFGTIGYRDVPGSVPSTILNFNYNSPADNPFIITVEFKDIEEPIPGGPIGTYYITVQSRDKVTLNIFNYNTSQYNIVVNGGDPQNNSNIEIDVQGTLT